MTMTQDHEKLDSNLIATCVVAYTPCKHVFDQNLEKFHQLSPAIARWIDRISKEKWSMAYDTSGRRYGHMTTNLSECVNKVLKDCRSIPITALVKSTYSRCRKYFVDRGRQAQRQLREGQVYCSKLVTELGKNREQACSYIVRVYDIHLTRFECFVSHLDATLTSSVGPECVEFISIVQRAISEDTEMDKKIRSFVNSILKNASVPDADKDVPTSSTPNAEVLFSSSEEKSTKEEDQATEETPAPRAPEPAPGDFIDLEEVESDEEPIAKKAKKSGKKVPGNVPDAPLENISFHSIGNVERWKFVYQRRLALERELGRDALDCKEIMDLIKAAGLLKTVTKLGDCYESLVREFIVNIPSDITNRKSDEYQKVFVRGKCIRFSPAVINKYLGRPTEGVVDIAVSEHQIAKEITAKQVQHWPKKGKLSAGKLSVKYAILHRIGTANWVPTNHTSTVATESFAVKLPIAFPTVLCGIMLSQHPNILNNIDSVKKRESPLSLHYKLFEGTHVPDIVSTSGKAAASGAVSKDDLIAELKDTCKVLEATIKANTEKKMELERLIKRLSDNGVLELGHDIAVKGSLWAMKTEVVFPQHHRTIAGLQKYQCDDPEKDTDTSVSDAQQMFVACNTFHGHAPAFFGNILPFQQSPFVCLCPEFQHLTEVCETVVWEIDAQMQDHVTLAQ
ncbi:hypothetical protein GmHk_04G010767 [Glycine max]|nr:hypothetical protein GmHk_04G010767 [Glycine max]